MRPTVWALRPLLGKPPSHAVLAAELRTLGAQDCIFDLTKADEALEQLVEAAAGIVLGLFCVAIVAAVTAAQGVHTVHGFG